MNKNVEVLFYNRTGNKPQDNDFAVKLKTKEGEYKFFEDDKYEYYYPTQKTRYVHVYFMDGGYMDMTAEEALKEK